MTLKSAEQLGFAYDEGADTPEMISIESPGVMAANDEMRLLRVAQDIHRRGIRFALVMATDMRDLLFVADYLQTHCPNTQLVSVSTEEAFTHHEQISKLRGMLFATTYPLWMKNQDAGWTVPDQKTARSELRLLVVPNDASMVTYNATLAHLIELVPVDQLDQRKDLLRGLIGYGWPGDSLPTTPPIWITVAGQQGYYPIDVVEPLTQPLKRPQGPSGYGYYKNALWTPPTVFDLRMMSSLKDASGIPKEDKKNLIIVADVNHVLHFRIFDGDGKVVVDTDEKRLTGKARQIEDLRKQLESLWPHEPSRSDKNKVITAVKSITHFPCVTSITHFPCTRDLTWHRSWVLTSGVSPLLPPLLALVALAICTCAVLQEKTRVSPLREHVLPAATRVRARSVGPGRRLRRCTLRLSAAFPGGAAGRGA